ncbi:phosphatase PAP2 family protein [Plantibacter flavus]|uniref:phosphatase PAP2 family protein n=1 Tax=Plantibacter flavus TaxID=150123 RepID=UPI001F0B4C09|nr:phosphatase PAP2 family protein [Plantibacter flavus]
MTAPDDHDDPAAAPAPEVHEAVSPALDESGSLAMDPDPASIRPDPKLAAKVSRRWPLISGAIAVVLVLLLGVLLFQRGPNAPFGFDEEWMQEVLEERSPWLVQAALVMNWLGGGVVAIFVVPLLGIAVLLLVRRPWAALYFALVSALSAGAVQIIKNIVGRSRPEDILVHADFGSFPSGHSANAATIAVAFGIIFPRVWVWLIGVAYTLLMMLSRTYLGAHWVSDTIGGLLLGAGVALIIAVPLLHRMSTEPKKRVPLTDG